MDVFAEPLYSLTSAFLVYSKKTSLTSATVWRSQWKHLFSGSSSWGGRVKGALGQ